MEKKVKKCKICEIRPVLPDDRKDKVKFDYCKECFENGSVDKFEALKEDSKEKNTPLTEIENLMELIDREEASMRILLSAASADQDEIESDDIVMATRDSLERIEKMEASLGRLSEMVI